MVTWQLTRFFKRKLFISIKLFTATYYEDSYSTISKSLSSIFSIYLKEIFFVCCALSKVLSQLSRLFRKISTEIYHKMIVHTPVKTSCNISTIFVEYIVAVKEVEAVIIKLSNDFDTVDGSFHFSFNFSSLKMGNIE